MIGTRTGFEIETEIEKSLKEFGYDASIEFKSTTVGIEGNAIESYASRITRRVDRKTIRFVLLVYSAIFAKLIDDINVQRMQL